MAITNAQQYQQLVNKPANGKRPGYRGPGGYQSGESDPSTGASGNIGGGGAPGPGDTGGEGGYTPSDNSTTQFGGGPNNTGPYDDKAAKKQKQLEKNRIETIRERQAFTQSLEADKKRTAARKRAIELKRLEEEDKLSLKDKLMLTPTIRTFDSNLERVGAIDSQGLTIGGIKVPGFITGAASAFKVDPSTKYFDEDSIREIGGRLSATQPKGITATQADTLGDIREDITMRDNILDPNVTVSQSEFDEYINRNKIEDIGGDDGPQDPCKGPNPPAYCFIGANADENIEAQEEDEIINYRLMADGGRAEYKFGEKVSAMMTSNDDPVEAVPSSGLSSLLVNMIKENPNMFKTSKMMIDRDGDGIDDRTQLNNNRLMADGGRAALAEGGMPYEGGIMDLESSRQMYGLGKLVKKITRGVKKIAKSPIGKAALLYAGGSYLSGMGALKGLPGAGFLKSPKFLNFAFKDGVPGFSNLTGKGIMAGIGGISALSGFLTPKEDDDDDELYAGADIDDPRYIMNNPSLYTNRRLAAEGGSMDEPVAKKTMPLLDMDGQEMDLREEGGFVPLGRMERADDVPARLSKNEFVFTADAVRNAGEGDVDKGAEVMYNMMKNLESGGDVSEESQGLEGARDMFQTSQRLEEVI